MHSCIRDMVGQLAGQDVAADLIIQYGGSVSPNNASGLLFQDGIDGLLVGGFSIKATSFADIVFR